MAKSASRSIVLKAGSSLGANSAEADDDFLEHCFVKTHAYEELTDFNSTRMIAAGRTGAGKTAIIKAVQANYGKTNEVDPVSISMDYIANSDILRFLHAVGADLDLLFQIVWKHVLCVEYIRLRHAVADRGKWSRVLDTLNGLMGTDARRTRALKYLADYDGKFWIPADENVKEVVEKIAASLRSEFAVEFEKYKSKVHYERGMSSEKKAEIVARCRKIITQEQLRDLASVIDALADDKHQGRHFVLIDRLDEQWIEDGLRFRLIRALIETLKKFRKIRQLKLIVALRSDVLERVTQETKDLGFQKEKFSDYVHEIKWSAASLKQLVNQRIALLGSRRYDGKIATIDDLLPRSVGAKHPFDYILERTLMRPRDVLAYINLCLRNAEGKQEISATTIREVEQEYSSGRITALSDEWKSAFPGISDVIQLVGSTQQPMSLQGLAEMCDQWDDLALRIGSDGESIRDPIGAAAKEHATKADAASRLDLVKTCTAVLYRIGAIGLRVRPDQRILYPHIDIQTIDEGLLTGSSEVRLHPMLAAGMAGGMAKKSAA